MGVWRDRAEALGVSALLHALFVGGGVVLVFGAGDVGEGPVAVDTSERVESVSFFAPMLTEVPPLEFVASDVEVVDALVDEVDAVELALDALLVLPDSADSGLEQSFAAGGSEETFVGGADEAWSASSMAVEVSLPSEVSLAGSKASDARDVVYVVDASGSMVSTMPMVLAVLERSLGGLVPTQRFALLFITDGGYTAYGPGGGEVRLLRATRDELSLAVSWMGSVRAGGLGDPLPALGAALGLSPDAVFVLSKGIEPPAGVEPTESQILAAIDRANPVRADGTRRVAINSVQVISEDRSDVMWSLAQVHGAGAEAFRFVSRDELVSYAEGVAP